ncbi:MAG: four helix bundle protein [bacterium]|nr:four helix bundle protein [bacterium]
MAFARFEDIIAWQKSRQFVVACYDIFEKSQDFSFRSQILRAVVSIMNNIAEGFERKGDKQFSHFLYTSKGSCAEVKSMLYLALDLGYVSKKEFGVLFAQATELSKIITGLLKSI